MALVATVLLALALGGDTFYATCEEEWWANCHGNKQHCAERVKRACTPAAEKARFAIQQDAARRESKRQKRQP